MTSGTALTPLGARSQPVAAPQIRARLTEALPVGVQVGLDTLGTPVSDVEWVVVDVETTGLGSRAAITEIGAVRVVQGHVVDEFQSLVDPEQPIPPRITALTGITPSMVDGAPTIGSVYPRFARWAGLEDDRGRCRPEADRPVLVAHNANFDLGFLRRAATGCGHDWERSRIVDTLALARVAVPRPVVANHRLATLAGHFGAGSQDAHRALGDARATVAVLFGLLDLLAPLGATTIEDLSVVGSPVPARRRRRVQLADDLPRTPGVYRFVDANGAPLYVGSATNLRSRVRSYFTASEKRVRIRRMIDVAADVIVQPTSTVLEARIGELHDIHDLRPLFNQASTHQDATHWIVRRGASLEIVPAVSQVEASGATLGPLRGVGRAKRARDAVCASFPPATQGPLGRGEAAISTADVDSVDAALGGEHALVVDAVSARMTHAAQREDFEAAARWREILAAYLGALQCRAAVLPTADARRVIWARHRDDGGWTLHAASWGRLTHTVVTPPRTSPAPWVEAILADPPLPRPEVYLARSTWEEARLLTTDLLAEGSRLVHWDADGDLAQPLDSPLSDTRLLAAVTPRP